MTPAEVSFLIEDGACAAANTLLQAGACCCCCSESNACRNSRRVLPIAWFSKACGTSRALIPVSASRLLQCCTTGSGRLGTSRRSEEFASK